MPSTDRIENNKKNSRVLWKYETDSIRNIDYSSNTVSKDTLYVATSLGTIYALDADRGKQIWTAGAGEKSVTSTVSCGAPGRETRCINFEMSISNT